MPTPTMTIGTRGSPLALVQAGMVRDGLVRAHNLPAAAIKIAVIRTTGDRVQDRPLAELGGKGLFTREIEEALLGGDIDLAVHSMKDVPTVLPDGLAIPAILRREDPRDAFFSPVSDCIAGLPHGARVGSASLRRAAQLRRIRPDLDVVSFRGNVETRLKKLAAGDVQATFLALAGIRRLGLEEQVTSIVPETEMLPAVAQGAIGIEIREGDEQTRALLAPLADDETKTAIGCERAFLAALDGSCHTPIAALAKLDAGVLRLEGLVISPDGAESLAISRHGAPRDAEAMGRDAGETLLRRGAGKLIAG